jgi:hypothetical protein
MMSYFEHKIVYYSPKNRDFGDFIIMDSRLRGNNGIGQGNILLRHSRENGNPKSI